MTRLPFEILDIVITKTVNIPLYNLDPLLSRLAQVSRRWRHLANLRRFNSITVKIGPRGVNDPTLLTRKLARLMLSDIWEEEEGVAQHVRRMCLLLQDKTPQRPSACQIEELETITDAVFGERPSTEGFTPLERKFVLTNGDPWDLRMFDFDTLEPRVVSLISRICARPTLTELEVNQISHIPLSLLCSISCPTLCLSLFNVTFSSWKESLNVPQNMGFLGHLKSLRCSADSQFLDIFLYDHPDHYYPESLYLRLLNVKDHSHALSRLYLVGRELKNLSLQYHLYNVNTVALEPVNYARIGPLRSLSLQYRTRLSCKNSFSKTPAKQTPILAVALNMLPNIAPERLHIGISASGSCYYHSKPEGAKLLWSQINYAPFVDYLARISQTPGLQITIDLAVELHDGYQVYDIDLYEKELSERLYLLFKPITDITCLSLAIDVTVMD